jgi:N-acetylglucosaminyl-diphospho-decaprenol L-rhamnosyltransferase
MAASLDIIIVNWNSGQHTRHCLESVAAASRKGTRPERVVVVDNNSQDDSAERLHASGLLLSLIRNETNRGFAAACNQGARGSQADYLLFLNPDVTLLANSLSAPLLFMEQAENRNVGICGIQLVDRQGRLTCSCSQFLKPWEFHARMFGLDRLLPSRVPGSFLPEREHRESKQVDQVMGAFFLVRRTVFESLHGFDGRFFVYFEDLDFSYRAQRAGFSSFFLATAQAVHFGAGCSEQVKATRLFYQLRSRIIYGFKHFGWGAATGLLIGTVLVEPLTRLVWAGWRGSIREMGETVRAYAMLFCAVPSVLFNIVVANRHQDESLRPLRSRTAD